MEIPSDIVSVSTLLVLNLSGNNFNSLPENIKQLFRLSKLILSNCNMLQSLPELPQGLQELYASNSNQLQSLPELPQGLQKLNASNCKRLQSLPELPQGLKELHVANCKQLQSLPELPSFLDDLDASTLQALLELSRGYNDGEIHFVFTNCQKLNEKANNNSLADSHLRIQHMIVLLMKILIKEKCYSQPRINICLPGSGIPVWFNNQCSGSSITIQLPQHHCNRNLVGFALCAVIEFEEDYDTSVMSLKVYCRYLSETNSRSRHEYGYRFALLQSIDSDHVFLGFNYHMNYWLPDADCPDAVLFGFCIFKESFGYGSPLLESCNMVKCCGVCPVYAHPNETKPSNVDLKFDAASEEECIECVEIMKSHNDVHDMASASGTINDDHDMASASGTVRSIGDSNEQELEQICIEQTNAPQQQNSFISQIFHKTKNLLVVGGLMAFVFGAYFYTKRAVGDTSELHTSSKSRKTNKHLVEGKQLEAFSHVP